MEATNSMTKISYNGDNQVKYRFANAKTIMIL